MKQISGVTFQQLSDEIGEVYLRQMLDSCPEIEKKDYYNEGDASLSIIRAIAAEMKAGNTTVKTAVKRLRDRQQQEAGGGSQEPKSSSKKGNGNITPRQQTSVTAPLQASFCNSTLQYYQANAAVGIGQGVVAADVTREKRQEGFIVRYTQGLQEDTAAVSGQMQNLTNQAASLAGQTISVGDFVGEMPSIETEAPAFDIAFTGTSAGLGFGNGGSFFLSGSGQQQVLTPDEN